MSKHNKDRRKAAKMARGRCPICGKTCRVAADGRSGHCETQKKSWRIEKVDPKGIGPGRVRHPELPRLLLDMIRWNHRVVGRYLHPTLEQWELGFMRDEDVVAEVAHWNRVAFAFIDFHHRRNLPLRPDEEELPLFRAFCAFGVGAQPEGLPADDLALVRACWREPAGVAEDVERVKRMDINDPWEPPACVRDWPA